MATVPPGPCRNPFLSPQATGASSVHPPPSPSAGGPSLHSAFAGLNVGAPPHQQQPLSPQATAASTRSNNPFLDTRSSDPFEDRPASRQLSAQELAELEGMAVQVVERETAPPEPQQPPPTAAPSRDEKARPLSPVALAAQVASTSYGEASGRRVAEGNEDFRDDDEALEAAIQASLAEASDQASASSSAAPAASPPPLPARSTTATVYAAPAGPPPVPSSARPTSPAPSQAPADPPPAYTPSTQVQESTLDAGPRVPDFARRPELEPQRTGWSDGGGNPGGFLEPGDPGYRPLGPPPGRMGGSPQSPSLPHGPYPPQHLPPPQPPRHPQQQQQHSSYSGRPSSSPHPPPQPPFDPTPSAVPIIGRPYLNNGQALVYPPTFHCWKCQNTGFKENDPTHPCRGCWKKYGRPYSTALALSWHPPPPGYQRPLGPPHRPTFPMQHPTWATPPGLYRPVVHAPPVGSVVYQPGDPRIGGAPCFKCGGSGVTIGFFEDGTCNRCGGVGRVF